MDYYACVSMKSRDGVETRQVWFYTSPLRGYIANERVLPFDVNNRYLQICTGTQNGANRLHDRLY
jgi:hypothetical protein